MSAMQRRKGASFERETCEVFREVLGVECSRNLGQARDGGDDITLELSGKRLLRIECKRREAISVESWLQQAEKAAKQNDIPIVVMRADNGESMLLMRFKDALAWIGNELEAKHEANAQTG